MFTVEPATADEFTKALSLMRQNMEQSLVSRGLAWDDDWTRTNYKEKENYSLFRGGYWIGFLSLEVCPDSAYVHTLQLTREAQGSVYGSRTCQWITAKAKSLGKQKI